MFKKNYNFTADFKFNVIRYAGKNNKRVPDKEQKLRAHKWRRFYVY